MRVSPTTVALLASLSLQAPSFSVGFHVSPSGGGRVAASANSNVSGHQRLRIGARFSTTTEDNETTSAAATKKKKKLGLLTFDLGKNNHRIICLYISCDLNNNLAHKNIICVA